MDSLPTVSPSMVLPPTNPFNRHTRHLALFSRAPLPPRLVSSSASFSKLCSIRRRRTRRTKRGLNDVSCSSGGAADGKNDGGYDEEEEVERALHMDGTIPGTSDEFVKRVSSRAYDMRRHLQQSFDTSSYDLLDSNPWRETSKPVYVLTQKENQLCTMKTRRNRSEVERELGLLFSKGGNWRSGIGNQSKQARGGTKFQMLVEDIREGVLIFDLCQKMRALAVLFRRGRTPPLPESLQLNLRARKRSLEDQDDLI
ncbi:hypothetical protein PIB30_072331 [Stylosanthes scabra]|uniref:Uncharacterized protein n=1 Tax=Stylosanthes scabra TaxID=79078 RepID=A0ABU6VPA9_9FABA|nr:hypothetical protein [Stylosanthes scabra]